MELYEQLGYTDSVLETIRLRLDKSTQIAYFSLLDKGLKSTANNILALSDIEHKICSGETVDTHFNLVDTRDNAVLLKEAEKQKAIKYFQQLIQDIKSL